MLTKKPWSLFVQFYWMLSLLSSIGFLLFFMVRGSFELALISIVFILCGVVLYSRLFKRSPWAILSHQIIGLVTLICMKGYLEQTDPVFLELANLTPAFGLLILLALGMFSGFQGSLLGIAVYGLLFGFLDGQWLSLLPALVALGMGVGIHTQLKRLECIQDELERLAIQDPMTGVFNRRLLQTEFDRYQALSNRQNVPLIVISWDLDDLKRINDTHGHAAGDQAILGLVKALKHNLRQEDVLFRMGGDEFLSLHLGLNNPTEVVERVLGGSPAVSVGWAEAGRLELQTAVHLADKAMYLHKRGRRKGQVLH